MRYLPLGLRSARNGVSLDILVKSSSVKSILAVFAMAKKCNTALVEPPNTMISFTAFSRDFLVMMSKGFKSFSMSHFRASPDATQSNGFSLPVAGFEEL